MAYSEPTEDIELLGPDKGGAYGFIADSAVTAGQVVALVGDNSVAPSSTDGEQCVGVATQTKAAGDRVQVAGPGTRVRFTAGASVSANTQLASHGGTGDNGTVADVASAAGDYCIGQAFEAGAAGETVRGIVTVGGQVN